MNSLRFFFVLSVVLISSPIHAASEVRLVLGDQPLFLGESFTFYVVVDDSGAVPDPIVPDSPSLTIQKVGGVASEAADGRKRYTVTYEAIPLRPGSAIIPSFSISAGGAVLETDAQTVEIGTPTETDQMELTVSFSEETCYVGQPITVTFTWESKLSLNGIRALDLRIPALSDGSFKQFATLSKIDPSSPKAIGIPLGSERVIAEVAAGDGAERPDRITFQRVVVPAYPGRIDLPAPTVVCAFVAPRDRRFKGSRYPSYFNNDFFDNDLRGEFEKVYCAGKPTSLQVLPLPVEGKPNGFDESGIIGKFQLDAIAEPTVLKAGQPLTLTLFADGHPFPQTIRIPKLAAVSSVPVHFHVPDEQAAAKLVGHGMIAVRSLRPIRPNTPEIPLIRIPYFDPATKSYGEATAGPIAITVTKADAATSFDADFGDGSALKNEVGLNETGIGANTEGVQQLKSVAPVAPLFRRAWWWVLLALPVVVAGIALWWDRVRARIAADPDGHRARLAHRRYTSAISSGVDTETATCDYLADRYRCRRGTHTLAELVGVAEQMEPEVADSLAALADAGSRRLAIDYGNSGVDRATKNELDDAVRRIESCSPSRDLR